MIRVFILAFAHTASTYLYKYALYSCGSCLGFFEPFNPFTWSDYIHYGTHKHYVEGAIVDDRHLAPPDALYASLLASMGIASLSRCKRGSSTRYNIEQAVQAFALALHKSNASWIVKDVDTWVFAEKIADAIGAERIVIPVRSLDAVKKSFKELDSLPRRILNALSRTWEDPWHRCHRFGLGIYAQLLGKKTSTGFTELYNEYMRIAKTVEKMGGTVLWFGERLEDDYARDVVKKLLSPSQS